MRCVFRATIVDRSIAEQSAPAVLDNHSKLAGSLAAFAHQLADRSGAKNVERSGAFSDG